MCVQVNIYNETLIESFNKKKKKIVKKRFVLIYFSVLKTLACCLDIVW